MHFYFYRLHVVICVLRSYFIFTSSLDELGKILQCSYDSCRHRHMCWYVDIFVWINVIVRMQSRTMICCGREIFSIQDVIFYSIEKDK